MPVLSSRYTLPVRTAEHVAAVCDLGALDAADHARLYVNLSAKQGGDRIDRIATRIRRADRYRRELVTGHAGSGKSTELLRISNELRKPKHGKEFHVVYVDANERLGMWNLRLPQIIIAMMAALVKEPRLDLRANPAASSFTKRVKAIAGAIGKELASKVDDITGIELLGASLKASQEISNQFRDVAAAQMQELLATASGLVAEVSRELGVEIVFVVDNLEKVPPQQVDGDRSLHDVLFVQELPLLDLPAHLILTYPISLNYTAYELRQSYQASDTTTLPMVSVRQPPDPLDRHRGDDDTGIDLLVDLLERRIDIAALFDERETARYLVRLSGGCVRDVMRYAGALSNVGEPPFTVSMVEAAIADFRSDYERLLGSKQYVKLLPGLAETGQFNDDFSLDAKREILLGLVALEYDTETWFDVHPLVKRTRAFRYVERAAPQR